jgi:hypothetical protein
LFILIGVGITNLAVNATILDIPRNFVIDRVSDTKYLSWIAKLITCMMCSGFWIGVFLSIDFPINFVYGGAIISLCSYVFGSVMDYVDLSIALVDYETEETEEAEE